MKELSFLHALQRSREKKETTKQIQQDSKKETVREELEEQEQGKNKYVPERMEKKQPTD